MSMLIFADADSETAIPVDQPIQIGRDEDNVIALPEDDRVSSHHARVSPYGDRVVIEDLESTEGIRVNGRMIRCCALHHGDRIEIGNSLFRFENLVGSGPEGSANAWQQVGGCRLVDRLDTLDRGEVYRGVRISDDKSVIVTVLNKQLSEDGDFARGFLNEAPKARRMNHRGLVRFLDSGMANQMLYVVMDDAPGESLEQIVSRNGPLRARQVLAIGIQICQALHYAAHAGFAPLDIRPANILQEKNGNVKLTGWYRARLFHEGTTKASRLAAGGSLSGLALGDYHFMAPEQQGQRAADCRSDIYALGTTLFYLLTGRPPFEGPPQRVISDHKMEKRPYINNLNATVPAELGKLIQRMMAVEVGHRPKTPRDVAVQMLEVGTGRRSPSTPSQRVVKRPKVLKPAAQAPLAPETAKAAPEARQSTGNWEPAVDVPMTTKRARPKWPIAAVVAILMPFLAIGWQALNEDATPPIRKGRLSALNKGLSDSPGKPILNAAGATSTDSDDTSLASEVGPAQDVASTLLKRDIEKHAAGLQAMLSKAEDKQATLFEYIRQGDSTQRKAVPIALRALGKEGERLLLSSLPRTSERMLPWLARAAHELNLSSAFAPLVSRINKDGARVRPSVFRVLSHLDPQQARAFAWSLMSKSDERLKDLAWVSLSNCATEDDLERIFDSIGEASNARRALCSQALKNLQLQPGVSQRIKGLMERHLNPEQPVPLRIPYAQVLAELDPEPFENLLIGLVREENPTLRVLGVKGLGGSEMMSGHLLEVLEEAEDIRLTREALKGFTRHPKIEAVAPIMKRFKNHPELEPCCRDALVATFGVDRGYHYASWKIWLKKGKEAGDPQRLLAFEKALERRVKTLPSMERRALLHSASPH